MAGTPGRPVIPGQGRDHAQDIGRATALASATSDKRWALRQATEDAFPMV